jgi:hypothetical protein
MTQPTKKGSSGIAAALAITALIGASLVQLATPVHASVVTNLQYTCRYTCWNGANCEGRERDGTPCLGSAGQNGCKRSLPPCISLPGGTGQPL